MAEYDESFDYLVEEIEISGDLIPCEFCGDLFPISVFIEHSSGCQPDLFSGIREPDPIPEAAREPVVTPATIQIEWDDKVLSPTANYGSTIKIEQLVMNDVYNIKPKEGGGSIMKKLSSLGNEKMTNIGNEKMTNMGNEKMMNSDTSNSYIHFKTDTHEQEESDSDEDDVPSAVGLQQAGAFSSERGSSTQGLDNKDFIQLSDDDNEENETVESFLQRANLELYKIKQNQERSRAKWKQAQYASYDSEEETYQHHHHEAGNIYYQDCY